MRINDSNCKNPTGFQFTEINPIRSVPTDLKTKWGAA